MANFFDPSGFAGAQNFLAGLPAPVPQMPNLSFQPFQNPGAAFPGQQAQPNFSFLGPNPVDFDLSGGGGPLGFLKNLGSNDQFMTAMMLAGQVGDALLGYDKGAGPGGAASQYVQGNKLQRALTGPDASKVEMSSSGLKYKDANGVETRIPPDLIDKWQGAAQQPQTQPRQPSVLSSAPNPFR